MPLTVGMRLGPFEIESPLGVGGMGEVYRARDTKLDRGVAIKVLPATLAQHPDRLARFEREARVLAALNHPNIAAIHGLEDGGGDARAIVMELVEGPTLADRIKAGPLALNEALKIAAAIADALEAAHEKGIVHRDLKPANVKASVDGVVKVLDFGLATAVQATDPDSADMANSPTLSIAATAAGIILGTAAYMSPEQAAGKRVDRRADIWSFGVVLWEMLTGKPLFTGETVSHTLADVLRAEISFSNVPAPKPIVALLKRCLDRDVKTRLRDIGEARVAIAKYLADPSSATETAPWPGGRVTSSRLAWTIAGALLLTTVAVGVLHFREVPPERQTLRYTIALPENGSVHSFAVSPDGRAVALAAVTNGRQKLWLHRLDALQAQPMPGTEDATYPFWSPDSRDIGFFTPNKLKRIAAGGGPSQSLCDVLAARGGSWSRDGVIVFSRTAGGRVAIRRVPASGGVCADVTEATGLFRFPVFLPGGRHFLYTVIQSPGKNGVYISSLDGSGNRRVLPDESSVVFAPSGPESRTGHILFVRENTVMAQPFDADRADVFGEAFPIADGVSLNLGTSYAPLTVSESGVLLFAPGVSADSSQIVWSDRTGKMLGPVGLSAVRPAALSPDGRTVAFARRSRSGLDLWLRDLVRGTDLRFTSSPSQNISPFWSPRGDRILFGSNRSGQFDLYVKTVGGSSQEQVVLANANVKIPYQWSHDGRFIVYFEAGSTTLQDLWVLPMTESGAPGKPELFLGTEFREYDGQISPDGHWMAYTSEESGQREVYVRPFPKAEGQWRISTAGGDQPRWRGDGKELFYLAANGKMIAVPIKAMRRPALSFDPGTPVALFDSRIAPRSPTGLVWEYDVTADGQRFLLNTTTATSSPPLTVVVNWNAGLKK